MPDRKMRIRMLLLESLHAWLLVSAVAALPFTAAAGDSMPAVFLHAAPLYAAAVISAAAIAGQAHLASYLLTGTAVTAALWLLPFGLIVRICLAVGSAVLFLGRIPGRLAGEKGFFSQPTPFCVIPFAILYIAGLSIGIPPLCRALNGMIFAYLINLYLYTNLTELNAFLIQNLETANLPGGQIRSTNRILMGVLLGIAAAAMLILPRVGLDRLILEAGRLLSRLLRVLLSHRGEKEVLPVETAPAEEAMQNPGFGEPAVTPAWLEALLNVLSVIVTILVIAGLLIAAAAAVIALFRRFYRPIRENDDEREFIGMQQADPITKAGQTGRRSFLSRFSPEASIRRIYTAAIEKGRKKHRPKEEIPKCATPKRLEDLAEIPAGDRRDALHRLYEKARYSGQACTRADLEEMKRSASQS